MDILKMIVELREQRTQMDQAILVLEKLAQGQKRRRGRPPAWMMAAKGATKRRGRPRGSKNKPKLIRAGSLPADR